SLCLIEDGRVSHRILMTIHEVRKYLEREFPDTTAQYRPEKDYLGAVFHVRDKRSGIVLYRTHITRRALDDRSVDRLVQWSLSRQRRKVGNVIVVDKGGVMGTAEEA